MMAAAFLGTGALLGWMIWAMYMAHRSDENIEQEHLRVFELSGAIQRLDETLTMTARLAAFSGDPAWEARYRAVEPELDAAIQGIGGLSSVGRASIEKLDDANRQLVGMENDAFARVRDGRLAEAQAILASPAYERQKRRYQDGLQVALKLVRDEIEEKVEREGRGLQFSLLAATALALLLGVAWLLVLRAVNQWQAILIEQSTELTRQSHELATANKTLDQRVADRTRQLEASRIAALNMMQDANEARLTTEQTNRTLRQEIDERRGLEAQLRRLWQAIEQSSNVVIITDAKGRIEYVNPSFIRVTGYLADEAVGKTPAILKSGEQSPEFYRDMWSTIGSGQVWTGEFRNRRKSGELYWAAATISAIKDESGTITNYLAIQDDITARRQAEAAARESDERFRQLAEHVDAVFWMTDPGTNRMLYISPAYERIWGRTVQSVYDDPQSFADAVHPDDRAAVEEALAQQARDGNFQAEYRVVKPDGSIRWISDRSFPIRDASGGVFRVAGIAADVTAKKQAEAELKAAEAQLQQAAKMEAVGKLASGIAHDFNNYLSVIHGFAELAQMQHADDPKLLAQVREILHASESGTALIQQLMAFSRRQPAAVTTISLTDGVSRVRPLLQQLAGDAVRIEVRLPESSMLARLDPTGLEQILMNLASNARDAMKRQGLITIEVNRVRADAKFRLTRPWASAEAYVRLSVADTGPGMAPEMVERIFEPFFTTKQLGQGTGLGLAVVYGLVRQYGGHIEVETARGQGTAFRLYFPSVVADAPAHEGRPSGPEPRAPSEPSRRRRVLIVDDEPGSRQLCQEILQDGYDVAVAASGREALELIRAHAPDLLLTDIQMPEMDGVTLIDQALQVAPGLRVAAMSAYMTPEREGRLKAIAAVREIVRKPLAVSGLREAVARSLGL